MLSFWIPGAEPPWLVALFAVGFAALAVIAAFAVMRRRAEEPDAVTIAALYATGLGILAVSEGVYFLEVAFGWSLAAVLGISGTTAIVIAGIVTGVALLAIALAAAIELREEQVYRRHHALGVTHGVAG